MLRPKLNLYIYIIIIKWGIWRQGSIFVLLFGGIPMFRKKRSDGPIKVASFLKIKLGAPQTK
jgi:hypothetical protein